MHIKDVREQFEAQQEVMTKIAKMGFANYAETLPGLRDAFDLEEHKPQKDCHRCICCMDGRTPFGVHAAGSGILLPSGEFDAYIKESNPDSISSHSNCGAAKIAAERAGYTGNPDDFGKEWAEEEAKKRGLKHIHIEVEGPHCERVCYYDGTGEFNYAGVGGLPKGFVVGRRNMTKEASLAEVGVAINIIFGDHGFGPELLTEKDPFLLVAIGKNAEETSRLETELLQAANKFGKQVMVDSFTAPA